MGVGRPVERQHGVHPHRELAGRGPGEQVGEDLAVRLVSTAAVVMPRSLAGPPFGSIPTYAPPSRTSAIASASRRPASSTASKPPDGRTIRSAPAARTNSSSDARARPVTVQPAATASRSAKPPTAPAAPVTSSVRPAAGPSSPSACAAARPLTGTAAASTRSRVSGTTATNSAPSTACSAYVPSGRSKPGAKPATRVPRGRSTPGPTATTVPATSQPRPVWSGWWTIPSPWKKPSRVPRSTGLTPAAATSTRSCPRPGSGTGTSMTVMASGAPGVMTTAAPMDLSSCGFGGCTPR